jgi:hypothetical protein
VALLRRLRLLPADTGRAGLAPGSGRGTAHARFCAGLLPASGYGSHRRCLYAAAARTGDRARARIEREPDWPQYAPLCNRHARSLARSGRIADDAGLASHWRSFRSAEIEYTAADFPAWMLLAESRQLDFVPVAAAADEAVGAAYAALHALIRSDGDMGARRALRALRPQLLQAWLAANRMRG